MVRERRAHAMPSGRRPLQPWPGILALTGALAVSPAGCMCLPAPSPTSGGSVEWAADSGSAPTPDGPPAPRAPLPPDRRGWAAPLAVTRPGGRPGARVLIGEAHRADRPAPDPSLARIATDSRPAAGGRAEPKADQAGAVPVAPPHPSEPAPGASALSEPAGPDVPSPLGSAPAESTPAPAADIRAPAIPPAAGEYPIDLPAALRLAERENPVIAEARSRIGEALANQQRARVELLPTLNTGGSYDGHAGNLQQSKGTILNLSRQNVYIGSGAWGVAPGAPIIPGVLIQEPLADPIYDPLATHQLLHQARFDASATANSVLLEVAGSYLELLGATARLEADRRSVEEAAELMRITERYARTGEGRPADFHRAQTEWRIRRADVRRAEEEQAVAAARLSRRLHLDPAIALRPLARELEVLALVDLNCELPSLIATALRRRPEVQAAAAGLSAAAIRLKQAYARPLLPTLYVMFSGAAFGGGSNLAPPLIGNFRGRTDLDAGAYWTFENLGFGNLAEQKQRRAQIGEATGRQARTITMVREQVAAAYGEARALREKVEIARDELATATEGFGRDRERALQAVPDQPGRTPLPIEVINSLKLLIEARRRLIRTIVDYDQAQFRLFVAMGSPPPLEQPADPSSPPVSIATLSAPVTDGPEPAQPPQPGPSASAAPVPARPDPPNPSPVPALAAAEADLARTLERLRRDGLPGEALDRVAGLAKAHQKSMSALLEYDRLQVKLFQSLDPRDGTAGRAAAVDHLQKLAEARRTLLTSKVEFDEAVSDLLRRFKAKAPPATPEPSITRRESKDAGASSK